MWIEIDYWELLEILVDSRHIDWKMKIPTKARMNLWSWTNVQNLSLEDSYTYFTPDMCLIYYLSYE